MFRHLSPPQLSQSEKLQQLWAMRKVNLWQVKGFTLLLKIIVLLQGHANGALQALSDARHIFYDTFCPRMETEANTVTTFLPSTGVFVLLTVEPERNWPLRNAVCHMRRCSIMWDNCEERSISSGLVAKQELHNATSILTWVDALFPLYMRAKLIPERRCAAALCRFESPQTGWNKVADWSYLEPENVQKETVFAAASEYELLNEQRSSLRAAVRLKLASFSCFFKFFFFTVIVSLTAAFS